MRIIADTHVHMYSCYDQAKVLRGLDDNLRRLGAGAVRTAFLVERYDCQYYSDIRCGKIRVSDAGMDVSSIEDGAGLVIARDGEQSFFILPGRQIVTSERIEILALMSELEGQDNLPAKEVIRTVRDTGGVPIVAWAPGKWLFGRGKVVRDVIESFDPGQVFIGDTTLRPSVLPEPPLMKLAREKGFTVIAGSDPLPFRGEEVMAGTYAAIMEGEFDMAQPASSIRAILERPSGKITCVGKRCGIFQVIRRLIKNAVISS
ncbi:hypothetical protein ACFLS1_04980 [Verrucomicrobiota bacterium]